MSNTTSQGNYFDKVLCSSNGKYYLIMNSIHLVLIIGTLVYPLIIRKRNKYDFIYIIFLYVVMLQWILFKNECVINYVEKVKIDPEYKLGTNIDGPGLNYILSNFNISLDSQDKNNVYNEDRHNLIVPLLTLLLFSYIIIRYFNNTSTRIIHIFIYTLLVYVLVFKVCRKG